MNPFLFRRDDIPQKNRESSAFHLSSAAESGELPAPTFSSSFSNPLPHHCKTIFRCLIAQFIIGGRHIRNLKKQVAGFLICHASNDKRLACYPGFSLDL
ncbi:hypothetical protein IEQ34_002584 [Dendrobium chrysotoxum]|uniref:Uncharacterized protein n=1 Tax=Dendrobium chrysotoxum TaxID=161865 RepID=A0AAV7HEW2_DENCH|nr:hypothetical protein IEQ34_002584 [Dendrobium chrysotoxum]